MPGGGSRDLGLAGEGQGAGWERTNGAGRRQGRGPVASACAG